MYALAQSGVKAIVSTWPFTAGATGASAPVTMSYAITLVRVTGVRFGAPTVVNDPTVHIRDPHWRVIKATGVAVPSLTRYGVFGAGVAETVGVATPVAASATTASLMTAVVKDMPRNVRADSVVEYPPFSSRRPDRSDAIS